MFDLATAEGENTGWKPLKPGIDVPAILQKVEFQKKQDGTVTENLVFSFKGTAPGNTGEFNHVVWANSFDTNNEKYNEDGAKYALNSIKHILGAYLPKETVDKIKGANFNEFATVVIKCLNPAVIKRPVKLKVILTNTNKNTFPTFPDFITSDLTPERSLVLNTKVNPKTGWPYDRITPVEIDKPENPMPTTPNLSGLPPLNLDLTSQTDTMAPTESYPLF